MDALFEKLLSLSLQAGVITLAVIVLRLLLKKAPEKLICSLWLLVALRLLIPFSLESPVSLMQEPELPEIITEARTQETAPVQTPVIQEAKPQTSPQPMAPVPTQVSQPRPTIKPLTVLELIWAVGVLGMLTYGIISYGRLRRKVAPALEVQKGIYFCDYIQSPFVMGTFRPRIYLPSSLPEEDIPYILAHEQAHISRLDPLWKLLGFFLLTLHWFNPLLWIGFILFCRDMEAACDEKVITRMGNQARVPYSNALLSCSLPRGRIYPLAFGEIGVKQRIKAVLSYKKPTLWISLAAVLALAVTGICLLTNRPGHSLKEVWSFPEGESIRVSGNYKIYQMGTPEELDAVTQLLQDLRYDPDPVPNSLDPYTVMTMNLTTGPMDESIGLFFSPDGSQVSIGPDNAVESTYEIRNPDAVLDFFDTWLRPFANRDTSGKPLWQEDAPWVWTKDVKEERLQKVNIRTWRTKAPDTAGSGFVGGASQGGGIYSANQVSPLLKLLHSLQKEDFTPVEAKKPPMFSISAPTGHEVTCATVFLQDEVDKRMLAIRQEDDDLDFFASVPYETLPESPDSELIYSRWKVDSPELLSYMQSLSENSPTLTTFVGWEHDWDLPRDMSHGDARIQLPVIRGWEVKEVPWQDDSTAWGFRIRPEGQEGWLFFGFWPQGFTYQEEDRYYSESGRFGFDKAITSYPASVLSPDGSFYTTDVLWSFQLFQGPIGDYAILNEGADSWIPQYRNAVDDICLLTNFQAMLPEDMPKTAKGPDISLWQKTVSPEDLEEPALQIREITPETAPNEKTGTIHLNAQTLEPFLSVLRSLREDDIQDMKYLQNHTLQELTALDGDNETTAALWLPLKEHGQVLLLIYHNYPETERTDLHFYVTEEYEAFLKDPYGKLPYSEYYLNDDILSSAIGQLVTQTWSQEWRAPITIEHGKAKLSVPTILSWEFEEVPYADDSTPFGVRIRPKGEEGWLFASFCPQGYLDVDTNMCLQHYRPEYAPFGGFVCEKYPEDAYIAGGERRADACWEFRLYRCSFGDYVIFNENADSWMPSHRDELNDTLTLLQFQGDPVTR